MSYASEYPEEMRSCDNCRASGPWGSHICPNCERWSEFSKEKKAAHGEPLVCPRCGSSDPKKRRCIAAQHSGEFKDGRTCIGCPDVYHTRDESRSSQPDDAPTYQLDETLLALQELQEEGLVRELPDGSWIRADVGKPDDEVES